MAQQNKMKWFISTSGRAESGDGMPTPGKRLPQIHDIDFQRVLMGYLPSGVPSDRLDIMQSC
jgi:hypothetical protein